MFYVFSHILQSIVFPPGINLWLGLSGAFLWKQKSTVFGIVLIMISFVSLWIMSTPIIGYSFINKLQYQYPILQINKLQPYKQEEAIVVLGGGASLTPEYEAQYSVSSSSLSRIFYAAHLYHQMNIPIIVSGGSVDTAMYTEADLMANALNKYFNIPVQWKEDKSVTTADEGKNLIPIFSQHHIKTIFLVTSAWHMPRAIFAFRNSKVKLIPAPMDYLIMQPFHPLLKYLPSMQGLSVSNIAIHEYAGLLWYKFN